MTGARRTRPYASSGFGAINQTFIRGMVAPNPKLAEGPGPGPASAPELGANEVGEALGPDVFAELLARVAADLGGRLRPRGGRPFDSEQRPHLAEVLPRPKRDQARGSIAAQTTSVSSGSIKMSTVSKPILPKHFPKSINRKSPVENVAACPP